MSLCDVFSWWRCPNCNYENRYNLTWQHFYKFKEVPNEWFSKEKCDHCGKEYYVNNSEPNPYCFQMNKGKCKNDYIKNMVIDTDKKLTVEQEIWTD